MESPNKAYSPAVDQVRGIAALLVFFYHSVHSGLAAIGQTGWPRGDNPVSVFVYEGHTGVSLFMVLSGYILAQGTFSSRIDYLGFVRNRALRIFPLAILVLAFSLYAANPSSLGQIVAPFLLLINTHAAFNDLTGLSGTLWTAAVEFQFYLVAPFLFAAVASRGFKFSIQFVALLLALRVLLLIPLWDSPERLYQLTYFTIVGRGAQFVIGITLAYVLDCKMINLSRRQGCAVLILAGSAVCLLLTVLNRQGGISIWHAWHVIYPETEALLWSLALLGFLALGGLPGRPGMALRSIGIISFGIYVLHYAIESEWWGILYPRFLRSYFGSDLWVWLMSAALLLVVLPIARLSFVCIEVPFLRSRGRYLHPWQEVREDM